MKLNSEHIRYVMDSLKSNTAKIGNIKAYTLAALYNAPVTMGQYYTLVSHDIRGADQMGWIGGWRTKYLLRRLLVPP